MLLHVKYQAVEKICNDPMQIAKAMKVKKTHKNGDVKVLLGKQKS